MVENKGVVPGLVRGLGLAVLLVLIALLVRQCRSETPERPVPVRPAPHHEPVIPQDNGGCPDPSHCDNAPSNADAGSG